MAFNFYRDVGEALRLTHQLFDGNETRRVFVELLDQNSNLLEPIFEIPHRQGGEYGENVKVMPSGYEIVKARFEVRFADGVTADTDFIIDTDIYELRESSNTVKLIGNHLEAEIVDNPYLEGQIFVEEALEGELHESDLEGEILENSQLEGNLYESGS